MTSKKWKFWIDRGGTFTDIIGYSPQHKIKTIKLLSNNPQQYQDAAVEGIKKILGIDTKEAIDSNLIDSVKMGTTVATNALLEKKGVKTALLITQGLKDVLRIGYQNRPRLFDLDIKLSEPLYQKVIEVEERVDFNGKVLIPLNLKQVKKDLTLLFQEGYRYIAITLMHAYQYPEHEEKILEIAQTIGFEEISTSYRIGPLIKLVGRGDTTVANAYLNPILQEYVKTVSNALGKTRLFFMQSNSGLTSANTFKGKDAILSGPAGGIVGMANLAKSAGIEKIIGFDMGGTSTDVSHYNGEFERSYETVVSGVRLRAPMMNIHTVAAGGGSILKYDGMRFTVGPESAGAIPGPACYRNGGSLTVTDCNVMLGQIDSNHFPQVFGSNADQPIDVETVKQKFEKLAKTTQKSPEEVAAGFRKIAVENMVNAIRKISVQRGYDITQYVLGCFGGAGAQHACQIAESLGMKRILIHPLASVLSAYGMGQADLIEMKSKSVEQPFSPSMIVELEKSFQLLEQEGSKSLQKQGLAEDQITLSRKVHVRYSGTNTEFLIGFGSFSEIEHKFRQSHRKRFGFEMKRRDLMVGTISVEAKGGSDEMIEPTLENTGMEKPPEPKFFKPVYLDATYCDTPFYHRNQLLPGQLISGPAVVIEENSTILIDPNWEGEITEKNHLILRQREGKNIIGHFSLDKPDPIKLEIFNNLFMSIAEQMGEILSNTAYSVNIKERRDFSCALFDREANLIANAPHMPVHLGSMGESVRAVIKKWGNTMQPGDSYILNDPYDGGTHLPDITLVTPVYYGDSNEILFYVASRGHHADVGGITPGSMASDSQNLEEEGVLISNQKIVDQWQFLETEIRACFADATYPARNINQNIEDLKAQLASNEKGVIELIKTIGQYGQETVLNYVRFIQDNAEESVRRIITGLTSNQFELKMDQGCQIRVAIEIDRSNRKAVVDFTGTSPQQPNNFNAPFSVCRAAVLYVFRCLVSEDIPMNEGCLRAIDLIIPPGSMLNPTYPAAVVAGNVETSQAVVDALFGALGVVAEAQGTMNNLTFGNARHQYYETICGGTGAGKNFNGSSAVHSHMTNSLMTDPEILEMRFPVLLKTFKIREGSGGKGKFNGGDGVIREIEFKEAMTVSILSNHRIHPPYGLDGGQPGKLGRNQLIRHKKNIELKSCDKIEVKVGDIIRIETPGGGGWGVK